MERKQTYFWAVALTAILMNHNVHANVESTEQSLVNSEAGMTEESPVNSEEAEQAINTEGVATAVTPKDASSDDHGVDGAIEKGAKERATEGKLRGVGGTTCINDKRSIDPHMIRIYPLVAQYRKAVMGKDEAGIKKIGALVTEMIEWASDEPGLSPKWKLRFSELLTLSLKANQAPEQNRLGIVQDLFKEAHEAAYGQRKLRPGLKPNVGLVKPGFKGLFE